MKDLRAVQLSHLLACQPLKFRETASPRVVFFLEMLSILNELFFIWPSLLCLPFHSPTALIKNMLSGYSKRLMVISALGFHFWILCHFSNMLTTVSNWKECPKSNLHPKLKDTLCLPWQSMMHIMCWVTQRGSKRNSVHISYRETSLISALSGLKIWLWGT